VDNVEIPRNRGSSPRQKEWLNVCLELSAVRSLMEDAIMTTTLSGLLNQGDAATSQPSRLSITTTSTSEVNDSLIARIGACHRQAMEALTTLEAEEWYAEQNGLIDALIERDWTHQYQDRPALRERYTRGLEDGRVIIQVAKKTLSCRHS
jgi:hypothetical protein